MDGHETETMSLLRKLGSRKGHSSSDVKRRPSSTPRFVRELQNFENAQSITAIQTKKRGVGVIRGRWFVSDPVRCMFGLKFPMGKRWWFQEG